MKQYMAIIKYEDYISYSIGYATQEALLEWLKKEDGVEGVHMFEYDLVDLTIKAESIDGLLNMVGQDDF